LAEKAKQESWAEGVNQFLGKCLSHMVQRTLSESAYLSKSALKGSGSIIGEGCARLLYLSLLL
jgi:hypothetical protein